MNKYAGLSDNRLLQLCSEDDELAFTEIFNRYWKFLFRVANNILQNPDVAQDVVQEVFINLWQRKKETPIESPTAYLKQATRFQVLKAIRDKKTDDQFLKRLASVTVEVLQENPLLFKEQQKLLNRLIDLLPADCKEAFRLSRDENLTYRQIARKLNISEKTVEKRISKSLKYIRNGISMEIGLLICFMALAEMTHY